MTKYGPAILAVVVLGLSIGVAQRLLEWGAWPLLAATTAATLVVGLIAERAMTHR